MYGADVVNGDEATEHACFLEGFSKISRLALVQLNYTTVDSSTHTCYSHITCYTCYSHITCYTCYSHSHSHRLWEVVQIMLQSAIDTKKSFSYLRL